MEPSRDAWGCVSSKLHYRDCNSNPVQSWAAYLQEGNKISLVVRAICGQLQNREGDFVKKSPKKVAVNEKSRWRPGAEKSLKRDEASIGVSGLNLTQLKMLKLKLGEIREELLRSIDTKTQHVLRHAIDLENTLQGDDAEVAEKQRLSNSNLQEMEFLKSRLSLVERALMKMREGVYGIYEETEEPIGFERLQVVPWARFSIKVQEKREIRSREFGRIQRAE